MSDCTSGVPDGVDFMRKEVKEIKVIGLPAGGLVKFIWSNGDAEKVFLTFTQMRTLFNGLESALK